MDILAVREATKWCADYIRSGKVHTFRNAMTINVTTHICVQAGPSSNGVRYLPLLWTQHE